MQRPRRNSDTRQASDSLGQLSLSKRGVRLIGSEESATDSANKGGALAKTGRATTKTGRAVSKTAAGATKTAAVSGRANAVMTAEQDSSGQAADLGQSATTKVGHKAGSTAARGTAKVARSSGKLTGKAVKGGIVAAQKRAAAAKGTKAAAKTTVTAGRGAAALARSAAAVATAVKAVIAGLASLVTSTPVITIIVGIIAAVIAIVAVIGWLLPSSQSQTNYGNGGDYPVGVAPGPWGGHDNGRIPESYLTPIPWAPEYLLREDATASLIALNEEYKGEFGHDFTINAAYRDYGGQEQARDYWCGRGQCAKAAVPGTSNHGWALATDFGGDISTFDTAEYKWMKDNAPRYGWKHPAWAEPGGSAPEAWHWDFWGWEGFGGDSGGDEEAAADTKAQAYAQLQMGVIFGLLPDQDAQFQCLKNLWMNESGWNHKAKNPASGAYGIPQALPGEKMASEGADWRDNPETQVDWGLKYIKERYESPCQAWEFWQSENPHWY